MSNAARLLIPTRKPEHRNTHVSEAQIEQASAAVLLYWGDAEHFVSERQLEALRRYALERALEAQEPARQAKATVPRPQEEWPSDRDAWGRLLPNGHTKRRAIISVSTFRFIRMAT